MSTHRTSLLPFRVVSILVVLAMFLAPISSSLASPLPDTNVAPAAPSAWGVGTLTDQNLWDLIAQMSVAEENTFIHGSSDNACSDVNISPWVQGCMGQAGWIPGIPTLGIPPLRLDDGPAGSRLGHVATAMPAPIGLTASFNRSLAFLFGAKVGIEQRSLNQDVWLAPMMNMVNIPTAGRNFETLGEDPYLSGELATQLVTGSQSVGLMATVKHYLDNDFENGRSSTTVLIDERTQHEVELQPFEKALKAGAASIMCSYNRVDDVYVCGNDELQNQIARGLFGFKGFIMSDWGATHTPQDLIHGLDMEQSGSGNLGAPVIAGILLTTTMVTANTTLFADSLISDTNIKVASVSGFTPTQTILIDTGANLETQTVAAVGTAGTSTTLAGGNTTLRLDSAVGATNIKVNSVSNFVAGQTIWLDTGANLEVNTIVTVGTSGQNGTGIDLAVPLSLSHLRDAPLVVVTLVGATNIKVASVTNLTVTDVLLIDTGANLETVAITSVGTSGATGTGVDITPTLSLAHASGAAVKDQSQPGTGITLTVALVNAHGTGAMVAAAIPAGATNIKVASVTNFKVGHVLAIDTGANQESATVTAVGTSGVNGSGLTITPALTLAHAPGALVSTSGTPAVAATNDMPAQLAYTGTEWKAALDQSVFRILTEMNNAGLLEGTQYGTHSNGCNRSLGSNCTAFVPQRPDLQVIQPEMFAAAQQIAEASAVLLKNDNNVLPLTCADLTTGNGVVLMGPTAISTYTGGGGSAHVRPFDPVQSTYDALIAAAQAKCGAGVKLSYVPGYDIDGPIVPSSVLNAPDTSNPYPYWTLTPADVAFSNLPGLLRQEVVTSTVAISGSQPTLVDPTGASDQLDATVNYTGSNMLPAGTAWRWTGLLTAPASPVSGTYQLRIFIKNQANASLYTEGLTTAQRRINLSAFPTYFPNSMTNSYATLTVAQKSHDPDFQYAQVSAYSVVLTASQQLHLDLRVTAGITTPAQVQFRWIPPTNQADQTAIAVAAASAANKAIDFVWDEGSEGSDRGGNAIANGLANSGYQDAIVSAVVAANPNTAVVLNTGDSVFMPWASDTRSILEMWYPGQMGGAATANVLLGNVNPGGKLPETFYDGSAPIGQRFPQDTQPAACADNTGGTGYYGTASGVLPGNPGNCPMYPGIYLPGFLGTNLHNYRTINYSDQVLGGIQGNGIFQGYRWFDKYDYTPLFPFGHGLSYTQFEYTNLKVTPTSDGLDVQFNLKNIGSVVGDEVPQVYIGTPITAPVPMPVKLLAAFERFTLNPGESMTVTLQVGVRELSYWSVVTHDWALALTGRPLYVGSSSRDIRLQTTNATLPTVAITPDRAPNANGWYTSTVTFTAVATTTAGIDVTCDAPRAYSSPDSITASVTMTCTDTANNTGTATANFKFDRTAPTVAPSVSPNPVLFNNPATVNANALDSTSGISATTCSAASTTTVGTKTVTCTATDNAGNRSAVGVAAYTVVYPYTGVSPEVVHTGTGPTGYEVTFRYYDPTATKVYLRGEWSFSIAASTTLTTSLGLLPSQWVPGAFPMPKGSWPMITMTLNSATGVWSYTTPMPPGPYTYYFYRNCPNPYPSVSGCTGVYDPGNLPWNTSGSVEPTSQVYVPTDSAFGGDDYSWLASNPVHGTLVDVTYPSPQSTNPVGYHYLAVYLPPNYNPNRAIPYPTLYLSHGAGGNEVDWSTQGAAGSIIDNLIAAGHVQPMVVVMTNFNGISGGTDGYRTDVISNVIPYVESHYNVSRNGNDRAFGGLSAGAMRANNILFNATTAFGYIGSWSIGGSGSPVITSTLWQNPDLKTRLGIVIGGGRFDSITVPGINTYEANLTANGIPFVDDRLDGGHTWDVWRHMLLHFASTMAFKHTTTSIAADSNVGSSVTFTATVTEDTHEPASPSGTVTFYNGTPFDDDHKLGSAIVDSSGHATLSISNLSTGAYTVTAVYSGDNFYNASTSVALPHLVGDYQVFLPIVVK
jgi:beta-glucosidase-like glycosyl hydrolase/enterochelin esterase-like enzyme